MTRGLSVLIFSATTPLSTGGVNSFAEELAQGITTRNATAHKLFGKNDKGIIRGFIKLTKDFNKTIKYTEIVHFISLSPYNLPFVILAKIHKKKIVCTYHGNYFSEVSILKKPHIILSYWLTDGINRRYCNMIVSPSEYLRSKLKIKKAVVIYNPSKLGLLQCQKTKNKEIKNDETILVTATNFNIKKKFEGLSYLISALGNISREFNSVKLLVFGDGENLAQIKSKCQDRKDIIFMGFKPDFHEYLARAAAYIHISGLDNQPYSVIEALTLGKIILCNDLDPLIEMVDPKNNYVVQMDSNSIAKALRSMLHEILENPKMFRDRGERNKASAINRYSTDNVVARYLKMYKMLIQRES